MPTPARPLARPSAPAARPTGNYVKFSDKMTEGLNDIERIIRENKETIDTIQDIGLQLTTAIGSLQSVAFKYATLIDGFLDKIVPLIERIPLIDKRFVALARNAQTLAQTVVDSCRNTQAVVTDVRAALTTADVTRLRAHSADLQKLSKGLETAVAKIK